MTIFYAIPYVAALALQVPLSLSDLINVLLMSACIHMLNALTPLPGDTGWTESAFILIFAVLFGSYSIVATLAGIPSLSLLKSIILYFLFCPPPL